jgi:hypothetical protein
MKPKKFLLYIDILGFSRLVKKHPEKVRRLYYALDNLNCFKHDNFKTIVFSDTIIVYNSTDAIWDDDKKYIIMYLIEFAQNLLYETLGMNIWFRAVIVEGDFEHIPMDNFERYFGKALVKAYLDSKKFKYCGLLIEKKCQKYNDIFEVHRIPESNVYYYVLLNQALCEYENDFVIAEFIEETDEQWYLAKDAFYLKQLFKGLNSRESDIKTKYINTCRIYNRHFPNTINKLKKTRFHPKAFSATVNWSEPLKRIGELQSGKYVECPPLETFDKFVNEAREKGKEVVRIKEKELWGDHVDYNKMKGPCGGAWIVIDVDRRTKIAKYFLQFEGKYRDGHIGRYRKGIHMSFRLHQHQERDIDIAVHREILKLAKRTYPDINFYIYDYVD